MNQATVNAAPIGFETMSSAMGDAHNYATWIKDIIVPFLPNTGHLLEIGPGFGQYTKEFCSQAAQVTVVDLSQDCLDALCGTARNLRLIKGDLASDEFVRLLGSGIFDCAVALNVLEHLKDDRSALSRLFSVLKPGGCLILLLPAFPRLYGPMDRLAGHYRRYSQKSFQKLLTDCGFHILDVSYFNPIGGLGWWFNARLGQPHSLSENAINRQILFFDRFLLPLSRLLSPCFKGIFGQSLWVVAQRPKKQMRGEQK